jgi:hypothetical protein
MVTKITAVLTDDDMNDLARSIEPDGRKSAEAIKTVKEVLRVLSQKMSFVNVTFTDDRTAEMEKHF